MSETAFGAILEYGTVTTRGAWTIVTVPAGVIPIGDGGKSACSR
jgi:hypothetical protein